MIEKSADADDQWDAVLQSRQEWINRPEQPPGLGRSGILELAASVVEVRRRKQVSARTDTHTHTHIHCSGPSQDARSAQAKDVPGLDLLRYVCMCVRACLCEQAAAGGNGAEAPGASSANGVKANTVLEHA